MFTRISFKLRMALLSMLLSGLVLLGFGGWALFHIQRLELRRYESDIAQYAARHLERPHGSEYWTQVDENLRFVLGEPEEDAFIMLVLDRNGKLLHKSTNWPENLTLDQLPQPADMPLAPRREERPGPDEPPGQPGFPGRPLRGNRGEGPGRADDFGEGRPPVGLPDQPPPPPPFIQGGPRFRGEGPPPGPPPRRGRMGPPLREGEPPRLPVSAPEFFNWPDGETTWRVGALGNPEVTLALGLNHSAFTAHIRQVRMAFGAAFGAALLFIAGGSWLLAWHALRPVDRLATTVERITARGLEQRIPSEAQDAELLRLVTVFNEMMDRLERSFYQTARFSADAAHELKTPLTILQGKIEQALQQAEPGSPSQQNFSQLLSEVQRLKGIIRKLLLMAQADSGRLKINSMPVNLSSLLEGLAEDMDILAPDLKVKKAFEKDLWVSGDPDLLKQVLQNLTSNAIKYNKSGGMVKMRMETNGKYVRMAITNTGKGIPQEDQDKVFQRFYRADKARTRQIDGVGLGLSLSREIARAHKGDLKLKASQDDKTTFVLTLPGSLPPSRGSSSRELPQGV